MSDQERERDVSPGGRDPDTSAPADQQEQSMPSPGAMVGITIPDPPEQGAPARDDDPTGATRTPQESEEEDGHAPETDAPVP